MLKSSIPHIVYGGGEGGGGGHSSYRRFGKIKGKNKFGPFY